MTHPSSDEIMTDAEARALGLSQAQWSHQRELNLQILGRQAAKHAAAVLAKQSQNSQATRNDELVASVLKGATNASNQIAERVVRIPKIGDRIRWGDSGNVWEITHNANMVDWRIRCVERGPYGGTVGAEQLYRKDHVISQLRDNVVRFVDYPIVGIPVTEPAKPVALPFKRHPKCEEKAVHMTAQMCLGCENEIRKEGTTKEIESGSFANRIRMEFHGENCECSECLLPKKPVLSGVISGYGSLVGGSWNGRIPNGK